MEALLVVGPLDHVAEPVPLPGQRAQARRRARGDHRAGAVRTGSAPAPRMPACASRQSLESAEVQHDSLYRVVSVLFHAVCAGRHVRSHRAEGSASEVVL